jgi:hypothetical protein
LTNDRSKCPDSQLVVVGNRYGDGGTRRPLLHDDVTSSPPHLREAVSRKNLANLSAGKNLPKSDVETSDEHFGRQTAV